MSALTAAATPPRSGAPYQLDRGQMELIGRRRSLVRTAVFTVVVLLLQQPLRWVAMGTWESVRRLPPDVPARLSLLLDLVMIVAYVVLAIRAHELARSRTAGPARHRRGAAVGLGLVCIGAAMDLVEDAVLWHRVGEATYGQPADLFLGAWSLVMWGCVGIGLLLGLVAAARTGGNPAVADASATGAATPAANAELADSERADLVVCCSGGGIRAASFCLGGLQALKSHYGRADAVVGVSGGGYMAAAHHVLRWCSSDEEQSEWAELDPRAYAPDSPEEKWLRRHSRYLLDSTRAGVIAVLSLLFGLAINLLFVVVLLGAAAWLTAWFLLASGGVSGWSYRPRAHDYQGDWAWLSHSWIVLATGIGLFLVAKVVDRVTPVFDVAGRERIRTLIAALVVVGLGLLVVLVGLPVVLVALRAFAAAEHSGTAADAFADLLAVLGFSAPGAGLTVSLTSLTAVTAAVLTTVRALGSSAVAGDAERPAAASALARFLSRAWRVVRAVVLPWAAVVVVVLLLVAVFLTWTTALLNDSADLARWELAVVFGSLLVGVLLTTDANRTSLHHFYRERLSSAYLVRRGDQGRPERIDYTRALRFSASEPPEGKGPALVSCAVANVNDTEVVPTDRGCTPFVFSHDRIGLSEEILPDSATLPSADYEFAADSRGRDATIPAAMAISGAAFSPLAGRENAMLAPYRFVLALANARLGVWLPNPLWLDQDVLARRRERAAASPARRRIEVVRSLVTKPSPFLVAREAFGRTSVLDRFLYVTDGGHYDNLGLVEALRRQPRRVIVLDASNDAEDTFRTLGRAIATARMDLGCDIDIDPRAMRRLEEGRAPAAWVRGRVTYRPDVRSDADGPRPTADLWIAKAVLLEDLPWDLETYRGDNVDFPRTSTADQFYGEFDLEAYRALGHDVVRRLVPDLDRPTPPAPEG